MYTRDRFLSSDFNRKSAEIKMTLCQLIKRSAMRRGWDQKTMARYMGTTPSIASLVDRCRLDKLTINQLFRYLIRLEPRMEILIAI